MNDYPSKVKEKLNSIIKDMADHHWLFTNNPGRDFSRQHLGKLSFYDTMRIIVGMGKGSTSDEIMDYFDLDPALIPSQSAFNQRRSQISLSVIVKIVVSKILIFLLVTYTSGLPDFTLG